MIRHASPQSRRRGGIRALARGAAVGIIAGGSLLLSAPSSWAAAADCLPQDIVVNTGSGRDLLLQTYTPTGELVRSAPLQNVYGDIAFAADGSTLFGVSLSFTPVLDRIDPITGAVTGSQAITGPLGDGGSQPNGLTALPDGSLLAGTGQSRQLYVIDPATGVSTEFRAALPAGFASSGDFLTLSDGDILAVTQGQVPGSGLVRIHPDNTTTVVGSVPSLIYGAAQSGDQIFLAGNNGDIRRIDSVPTAASDAAVAVTPVVATGLSFYGATSVQDAGLCGTPQAAPDSRTTPQGQAVNVPVLANDEPVDGDSPFDVSSVRLVIDGGDLVTTLDIPDQGSFTTNPDGTVTFTPVPDFTGQVSTVNYRVTDVDGRVAASTISITVGSDSSGPDDSDGDPGNDTDPSVVVPTTVPAGDAAPQPRGMTAPLFVVAGLLLIGSSGALALKTRRDRQPR